MKKLAISAALSALLSISASPATAAAAVEFSAEAVMKDTGGRTVGKVILDQTAQGLLIRAHIEGLREGAHDFQVGGGATCASGFRSAGRYSWTVSHEPRADRSARESVDEFPSIYANADGTAQARILIMGLKLKGDKETILDTNGVAFVIREKRDPRSGQLEIGDQIACGVIKSG